MGWGGLDKDVARHGANLQMPSPHTLERNNCEDIQTEKTERVQKANVRIGHFLSAN